MKCARVAALLPLYVEGDLRGLRRRGVAGHLRSCARCGEVEVGYRQSQRRLRLYGPPAFDDEVFDEVRRSVMRRIAREPRPPAGAHHALVLPRVRRVALAAAAVLIASAAIVAFLAGRGPSAPEAKPVADRSAGASPRPEPAPSPAGPKVATAEQPPNPPRPERTNREAPARPAPKAGRPPHGRSSVAGPRTAGRAPGGGSQPGPPQRIEIQTSDPLVRIIWFAPGKAKASGATAS